MDFEIRVEGVTQKFESKEEFEELVEVLMGAFAANTQARRAQTLTRGSMLALGDDLYAPYAWQHGEVVRWQRYVQYGSKSAVEINSMLNDGFTILRPEEEEL